MASTIVSPHPNKTHSPHLGACPDHLGRIVWVATPEPQDDPITRLQLELAAMNIRGIPTYPQVFKRKTISEALDLLDENAGVESWPEIAAPEGTPAEVLDLARDLHCMMVAESDELCLAEGA